MRLLPGMVFRCSAASGALAAAVTVLAGRAQGAQCWANSEAECVAVPGCRWFSFNPEGDCDLCRAWFGDQVSVTGCHDWTPQDYCQKHIFERAVNQWGKDHPEPSFVEAVKHYQITLGSGQAGDPGTKRSRCNLWCDASENRACFGHPRAIEEIKGVNYGGRFIPEEYLHLPGSDRLFEGVDVSAVRVDGAAIREKSLCDVGGQPNAAAKMAAFLDLNIKHEHFARIAASGFNVVRLPLGYWNLIDAPPSVGPSSPSSDRWRSLQSIMPSSNYSKWIDEVFVHARHYNLKVLLDFHGAPGGQSGNQFTGCDQGRSNHHFDTEWNSGLSVTAIEQMARICSRHGHACCGIELLNEPHSSISRYFLKDFYWKAIAAARKHLDWNTPLVIMDWTYELFWWRQQRAFSYAQHGRIMFSTHVYNGFGKHSQREVRRGFVHDLETISNFSLRSGHSVFVSEYGLSGHGSGQLCKDPFDYYSLANWLVHQFNQVGVGSAVWNFDAEDSDPWGPVSSHRLGAGPVEWRQILDGTPPPDHGQGGKASFCSRRGLPKELPVIVADDAARAGASAHSRLRRPQGEQEPSRTTAAGLWCACAVGLAVGARLLWLSIGLGPQLQARPWVWPELVRCPLGRSPAAGGAAFERLDGTPACADTQSPQEAAEKPDPPTDSGAGLP